MTEDILSLKSKENFRRKLLIFSRIIAVLLIVGIFFIGVIQIKYVNEVNELKGEYGSAGYCYLCGLETARSCSCNYIPDLISGTDLTNYLEGIAMVNVEPCEDRNKELRLDDIIFSDLINVTS